MGFFDHIKNLFRNRDRTHPTPDGAYRNAVSLPGDLDDAPEWIRIVPVGDFPNHPDGAHTVTVDDVERMVENFDRKDVDLLFDVDHESLFGNTRAAAWGMELEARDDGLYARFPDFTPYGEELVSGREYRYLSPVYAMDVTNKQGEQVGATIFSVAITNTPYFDAGEIDAIGNADDPTSGTDASDESDSPSTMDRDELIALLGLDDDATDDEIRQAAEEAGDVYRQAVEDSAEIETDSSGKPSENDDGDTGAADEGNDPSGESEDGPESDEDEEPEDLDEKINAAVDRRMEERSRRQDAQRLVDQAIEDGKILPADREIFLNSARQDLEKTRKRLNNMEEGAALPEGLKTNSGGSGGDSSPSRQDAVQYLKAQRG